MNAAATICAALVLAQGAAGLLIILSVRRACPWRAVLLIIGGISVAMTTLAGAALWGAAA